VPYQSLYRRYRPQKFSQIKGQDHVVRALQGAVRNSQVGHAYLLHGPRGSGKTSTARVLAKALNCKNLGDDGEPCCTCESCVSIGQTLSFDLQELDAASNNRVDDMRGLLEKVNLTTPGRAKVYLLDEVHMLTSGAENALLKTLEEPPDHVTWVLATTEPHKVAQTIRSRCQVFELGLIDADVMSEHLREIVADAELDVADEFIDQAVANGGGSVRDTLTALERIIAGGGESELDSSTDAIVKALAASDRSGALAALEDVVGRGRDPRTIGEMTLAALRHAFLTAMGNPPSRMSEHERTRAAELAESMSPAALTRALEVLGQALIEMRQAPDPRIDIEVALIRLRDSGSVEADSAKLEALAERVQQLEDRLNNSNNSSSSSDVAADAPSPSPSAPSAPSPSAPSLSTKTVSAAPVPQPPVARSSAGDASKPKPKPETSARRSGSAQGPAAAARQRLSEHRSSSGVSDAKAPPPTPAGKAPSPSAAPAPAPPVSPTAATSSALDLQQLQQMQPQSPSEVVKSAGQHLGLDRDFVIARAVELEPDQQRRREPGQLQALWLDLVAHVNESDSAVQADASPPDDATPENATPDTESAPEGNGQTAPESQQPDQPPEQPQQPEQPPEQPDQPGESQQSEQSQQRNSDPATDTQAAQNNAEDKLGVDNLNSLNELNESDEAPSHAQDVTEKTKDVTEEIGAVFPGTEFTVQPDPDSASAS